MQSHAQEPFADRETLNDVEPDIYEAIATLEFIGHEVTAHDIAVAADLDEGIVNDKLDSLSDRGIVVASDRGEGTTYEPANRGWSAAPDQASNPHR
ncbi:MAG TPA: hypothetical protein VFQ44_29625 [Streptosporangiaceae bacterium]|nr:hypothetical protein [Streptosporangiaceae bacterium]